MEFDFSDIFSSFFGGGGRNQRRNADIYETDLEILVTIDFNEAIFGCQKDISYTQKRPCKACEATGAKNGQKETCPHCGGSGQVGVRQGFMSIVQTCPHCYGTGQMIKEKCPECGGKAYEEEKARQDPEAYL